ncbi:MAG: hypothetical protein ONB46_09135 [candidate division KSB1 bacterium]|nr:hypothetical protein [candidate division KSB1 bacterium]MDZ7365964.1 hypothetical protein [candidate division KSB1 bacterium]MDZ7404080.1 hypothetical protein [candidate division KSB1 bacterium]
MANHSSLISTLRGSLADGSDSDFENATSKHFREKIQAPWFAYLLKGKGAFEMKEAHTFQIGSNTWQAYEQWPPRQNFVMRNLYFHAIGL